MGVVAEYPKYTAVLRRLREDAHADKKYGEACKRVANLEWADLAPPAGRFCVDAGRWGQPEQLPPPR